VLNTVVLVLQVVLVALVAWGGWLCLFRNDRRAGRDRRHFARGGRRRLDGPPRPSAVRHTLDEHATAHLENVLTA
jgi:hypothetical protein